MQQPVDDPELARLEVGEQPDACELFPEPQRLGLLHESGEHLSFAVRIPNPDNGSVAPILNPKRGFASMARAV
ncbi:MAG: hypothetical protein OHK0026_06040 [Rhodocyclaceae bacterium]